MIRRILMHFLLAAAVLAFLWGRIDNEYIRYGIDVASGATIVFHAWNDELGISIFKVDDPGRPEIAHAKKMGFGFYRSRFFLGPERSYSRTVYAFSAPRWFVTALLTVYPLAGFAGGVRRGWRRFHRRRRGLCIKCGYNLTGAPSSRCPECGTEFQP